ncbi:MAG: hypothetical protein J0M12_15405 [Deltaproteobacteria bacterium]|nr:hypothetical protein [Deltaproteobacteria bacterium]
MNSLEDLVQACQKAADSQSPETQVEAVLKEALKDIPHLKSLIPDRPEEDFLVHRSNNLTIWRIRFVPGVVYPPHDHGHHTICAVYEGAETNTFYEERGGELVKLKEQVYPAPCVFSLSGEKIVMSGNLGSTDMVALHLQLGDLIETHRHVWDPATSQKHEYSDKVFVQLAKYPPGYDIPVV